MPDTTKEDTEDQQLTIFNWVDRLPDGVKASLLERCTTRHLKAGEILWLTEDEGSDLYQVISGHVNFSTLTPDGKELLYVSWGPGDCFGENNMIDEGLRYHTAQAASDCTLRVLSSHDYRELASQHEEMHWELMRLMVGRIRVLCEYVDSIALLPVPIRIAIRLRLLMEAARKENASQSNDIKLRVTQTDIANMIATSRQYVSRVLAEWQELGILSIQYGHIVIHRPEALRQLQFE